jgi:hypothetical protein
MHKNLKNVKGRKITKAPAVNDAGRNARKWVTLINKTYCMYCKISIKQSEAFS